MKLRSHKTQVSLLNMSLSKSKEETSKKTEAEVIDVDNDTEITKPPATKRTKLKISPSAHIKKHFDPLTTKPTPYRFGVPGGPIFEREGRIKRLITAGDPEKMKSYLKNKKNLQNEGKKTPPTSAPTKRKATEHEEATLLLEGKPSANEVAINNQDVLQEPKKTKKVKADPAIKREFPYGSIVRINGRDMDDITWKYREDAPQFYGLVENPDHYDDASVEGAVEGESYVTFVICGEYEWIDKNNHHVMRGKYADEVLYLVAYPPQDDKKICYKNAQDPMRYFQKKGNSWTINQLPGPCYDCGCPWCIFSTNRRALCNIVAFVRRRSGPMEDKEKRWRCYRAAANHIFGVLEHRERRRLGWCFVSYVRNTFPEETNNFAGFRYANMGFTNDDESTESDGLREMR